MSAQEKENMMKETLRSLYRFLSVTVQLLILAGIVNTFSTAQAGNLKLLNFQTAFQIALENNKEIVALQRALDKEKLELKASSRFFQDSPDLTWEVKNREKSNSKDIVDYGGSISLPVEIRGQRKFRRQKAKKDIQIAELLLIKKKQEIKNNLKIRFLRHYILMKKMESLKEITGLEENLIRIMDIRTKHGESPKTELNMIKIEAAKTKEEMLQIKEGLAVNRQNVEILIFDQLDESVKLKLDLPDYSIIPDIQQIISYAKEHSFEIMNSQFEKDKMSLDYRLVKSNTFIPKVAVAVTYAKDDKDDVVGGAVSIPLPFANNKTNEISAAEKNMQIGTLNGENIQQKIISKLKQEYSLAGNLAERKEIYEQEIIPLAQQNIDDMKSLYEKGEVDFLSFEKVWDQWRKSNNEYLDILQNYYQALFSLEMFSGGEFKEIVMGEEK